MRLRGRGGLAEDNWGGEGEAIRGGFEDLLRRGGEAYGSMPAVSATLLMAEMTLLASSGLSLLLSSMEG